EGDLRDVQLFHVLDHERDVRLALHVRRLQIDDGEPAAGEKRAKPPAPRGDRCLARRGFSDGGAMTAGPDRPGILDGESLALSRDQTRPSKRTRLLRSAPVPSAPTAPMMAVACGASRPGAV